MVVSDQDTTRAIECVPISGDGAPEPFAKVTGSYGKVPGAFEWDSISGNDPPLSGGPEPNRVDDRSAADAKQPKAFNGLPAAIE